MTLISSVWSSLLDLPPGDDSFSLPIPTTATAASTLTIAPNFTTFASAKDRYRPRSYASLDGYLFAANGWDQPYYWLSSSTLYDMGSDAPSHSTLPSTAGFFTIADDAAGTTYTSGNTIRLKLCFRNSTTGKETAPQQQWASSSGYVRMNYVEHTMSATKDILVTWTGANVPAEYDKVAIYLAPQDTDTFFLAYEVAKADGTKTLQMTDASLILNRPYVTRYRVDKPPKFNVLASHLNRLFGAAKGQARVWYGQNVRPDGESVIDDIPDTAFIDVQPDDGNGDVTALTVRYAALQAYKRRGVYEITGDSPVTFEVRRIFADRGALNHRCIVPLDGQDLVLDQRGLYYVRPNAEPVIAGARQGTSESPFRPVWDRLNLSAADIMFGLHDEANQVVLFFVALDFDPIPRHVVVFDYAADRFVSLDTCRTGTAGGYLVDTLGRRYMVRADDLGWLWQDNVDDSEGVFDGDTTAAITTGALGTLLCSGAAFGTTALTGPPGCPFHRYDAVGEVLDTNRVYSSQGTDLTPLYYTSETAFGASETLAVGIVPAVLQSPKMDWNTRQKKIVGGCVVETDVGTGDLRFDAAINDGSFTLKREFDLSTGTHHIVPVSDRGWTWSFRISQSLPTKNFTVRNVRLEYRLYEDRQP